MSDIDIYRLAMLAAGSVPDDHEKADAILLEILDRIS